MLSEIDTVGVALESLVLLTTGKARNLIETAVLVTLPDSAYIMYLRILSCAFLRRSQLQPALTSGML